MTFAMAPFVTCNGVRVRAYISRRSSEFARDCAGASCLTRGSSAVANFVACALLVVLGAVNGYDFRVEFSLLPGIVSA
jgi:hypothetical protein